MPRIHAERLVALSLLLFSLAYFVLAFKIRLPPGSADSPFTARTFPLVLGPLAIAISLFLLLKPPRSSESIVGQRMAWGRAAGLIGLMGLYTLAINPLGFAVTSALFLAGGFFVLGERRLPVLLPLAIGIALGFWVLFTLLKVELDWGIFGRMVAG